MVIDRQFNGLIDFIHQDDPGAHEKFLKINRAYEVLKDEDLRKKYDMHGEEGLSDDFGQRKYESWKFYQEEFGKLLKSYITAVIISNEVKVLLTLTYKMFRPDIMYIRCFLRQ